MSYNIIPGVDSSYNFTRVVREALAGSTEIKTAIEGFAQQKAQPIPSNHNFETDRLPNGMFSISNQARLDLLINAPSWMKAGDVIYSMAGVGFELVFNYRSGASPRLLYRGRRSPSGPWSDYVLVPDASQSDTGADPGFSALSHKVRQDFALRRLQGPIGTAGRGAVALRFDDNPRGFMDKVLPVLKKYGLVGYLASAVRYYTETSTPYSEVQAEAINSGFEVVNHSSTHSDASGTDNILNNTVGAADALDSALSNLIVDVWTMPSMSGTKMDGYSDGRYISNFTDTVAGRAIMSRHAVANGYSGGNTSPLAGQPTVGQTHLTIEAMTLDEVKTHVERAKRQSTGVTLMMHSSKLDTSGNMTTADFDACMAYIAQERSNGNLLVLSASGMAFADSSSSIRPNFWPPELTPSGLVLETDYTVPVSSFLSSRGTVMELVIRMKGVSGGVFKASVKNDVTGLNASKVWTLTNSDPEEFVVPFTLPLSTPYNGTLTINFGRGSTYGGLLYDVQLRTT